MKQLSNPVKQVLFAQYSSEIIHLMRCYGDESRRLIYIQQISEYLTRVDLRWVVQLVSESQYFMSSKSDLVRLAKFPQVLADRIFEPETELPES